MSFESFYEYDLKKEEIIELMHVRKEDVINKLKLIIHPLYVHEFAKILHYSWQENLAEAEKISENLDFYPIDFAALSLNEIEFKYFYEYEQELRVGDYA